MEGEDDLLLESEHENGRSLIDSNTPRIALRLRSARSTALVATFVVGTYIFAIWWRGPPIGTFGDFESVEAKGECSDVQKVCTIPHQHCSETEYSCFKSVTWAMEHGVLENPDWYPSSIGPSSTFMDMQKYLATKGTCPAPCESVPSATSEPTPAPPSIAPSGNITDAKPCLCGFDIDRTLTAKQHSSCPSTPATKGIYDSAYGGGDLKLSPVGAAGVASTVCDKCYVAIVSRGDAGGRGGKMRPYIMDHVIQTSVFKKWLDSKPSLKESALKVDDWNVRVHDKTYSPFILTCPDNAKPDALLTVLDWYKEQGVVIARKDTYFFDDNANNIHVFQQKNLGFNVFGISCSSRDGVVGMCGAALDEIRMEQDGVKPC